MISNSKKLSVCGLIAMSTLMSALMSTKVTANSSYLAPLVKESRLLDLTVTDTIYIVGERGHLLSGKNIQDLTQLSVPSRTTLTAITALENNVWIVGHDASILYSSDAGQHWQLQLTMPELDRPFLDVLFANENEGVAVGAYGLFYRTQDGGQTWNKELHASVLPQDDIDYLDSIKEDPAFYEEELSFILPHFNRLSLSNGKLYMAGEAGMLAISSDFGRSWQRFDIDYLGSFFDVQETSNNELVAVGLRGNIFVKPSSSDEWARVETCVTTSLNSIVAGDTNNFYVTGNNGVLLSIDSQALSSNETRQPDNEGCAMHAAVKKMPNELSDSILNGVTINDVMLAVTASGIKQIELK